MKPTKPRWQVPHNRRGAQRRRSSPTIIVSSSSTAAPAPLHRLSAPLLVLPRHRRVLNLNSAPSLFVMISRPFAAGSDSFPVHYFLVLLCLAVGS